MMVVDHLPVLLQMFGELRRLVPAQRRHAAFAWNAFLLR